ncbi:LuxR C-terminal-related transcriptional regulator [Cellulomonas sp. ATA003]|uniref:LuxR C-terminal-related transcriptional regulator n=1 Tax=Cellulomonas sp. ATA003 TaxID=3073064 RepID=UPI0028735751|nr:LuxR C-terminal-related transcriptional regulator [Cellulomonas sp. ATA003]WNB87067.1 LuxR C-terminal-related transcriptional regulator [Cellulomonas sp. ATA003]
MDGTGELTAGRQAYDRGDWQGAYGALSRARAVTELGPADLVLLGGAAWWTGRTHESLDVSELAFHTLEEDGDTLGAAMRALDLAILWGGRGDLVVTSGWLNRARRLLADQATTAAHGYLSYVEGALALARWDLDGLDGAARRLAGVARGIRDPALSSLGLVLAGLSDLRRGRTGDGFAQLDEAMLPVLAGRLDPAWAGEVYCTVIHACHELGDLDRMRAWTRATERWCEQFRGEEMFSGICRVHRLQLLCSEGGWAEAEAGIERSGVELEGRNTWVAGEALYQLGEIRRLRGDLDGARGAYARARALGIEPQPGEALLLHATGDGDAAWSRLSGALAGRDRLAGARLLAPGVEVALGLGLVDEAASWCARLEQTAAQFDTPGLRAWAAHARGAVQVHERRYGDAVATLDAAAREYRSLGCRYETARVYEMLARAHHGTGEPATAAADRATALAILRELGAAPDVRRLEQDDLPGGLTDREAQVLTCVAAGLTNRQVARQLAISEKTVSRHLANIFTKIGVSSRTAAAAWAHENHVHGRA